MLTRIIDEKDLTDPVVYKKTGYAFLNNNLFDVIVSCFIENENYHIFEINDVLFDYEVELLI